MRLFWSSCSRKLSGTDVRFVTSAGQYAKDISILCERSSLRVLVISRCCQGILSLQTLLRQLIEQTKFCLIRYLVHVNGRVSNALPLHQQSFSCLTTICIVSPLRATITNLFEGFCERQRNPSSPTPFPYPELQRTLETDSPRDLDDVAVRAMTLSSPA